MITCDVFAKISHFERSYAYHLERACHHDEMLEFIDSELEVYRKMMKNMDA